FDAINRNSPGRKEIEDLGGSFFMVGDNRLAVYQTGDSTVMRYWNERTSAWESTWDEVSFPKGGRFMGSVNSRRGLIGIADAETEEITEVHPFHIDFVLGDGTKQISKLAPLRFLTPIVVVIFSFDTDYLFALSTTHIYYWNSDTPTAPAVRVCALRDDYRGAAAYARGSSLFFLYDGNAATMDEFEGDSGEWSRWTLGHNETGLLPNLAGLRGQRKLMTFSPELITVFAVSVADNSLWSLDVFDPFWNRIGDLNNDGVPAEIVSADGRTVFVRAGEDTVAVTVMPEMDQFAIEDNAVAGVVEEEEDEETKTLNAQLKEAREKRDGEMNKLRKIGVMLLDGGMDQKTLEDIESGFEKMEEHEEGLSETDRMRREIQSIKKSDGLYKKKLMKYIIMMSKLPKPLEKREEEKE
ncbi:hypothetical protein PFISCL1PPCAC_22795, partial [Pristionchus fissidentatus]